MTSSRFYRPQMAILTKKEKMFLGAAEEKGVNYFVPADLATRRIVDSVEERARVSYSFSHAIRNNIFTKRDGGIGHYGVAGISYRILYELLCDAFNSGEYFIDTYFDRIFDSRSVHDELQALNEDVTDDIAEELASLETELHFREDGEVDMRYSSSRRYASLQVWNNPVRKSECARVAGDIQEDIVQCLSSGRIPLRKGKAAPSTIRARQALGITRDRFFFASGQLIEHLKIFVELEEA